MCQDKVQKVGVEKLKTKQLPCISMFQSANAQTEII